MTTVDPRINDTVNCHPVRDNGDGTFLYKCQNDGYTFTGPARTDTSTTTTTPPVTPPPKQATP